uniref:Uncharacterized protein n=1 Tax=Oryza punctata TaxID=4537 RepID=A0A0E0MLZ3_ORYPU
MANLITYHLATWVNSAKTRNPTRPGSSHENMWLHVRLSSVTYEVKSLIDQATWVDSAKTWNPTRPGSSHENMWLHVRLSSLTYEVKSLIDQGNLPTILAHSSAVGSHKDHTR